MNFNNIIYHTFSTGRYDAYRHIFFPSDKRHFACISVTKILFYYFKTKKVLQKFKLFSKV